MRAQFLKDVQEVFWEVAMCSFDPWRRWKFNLAPWRSKEARRFVDLHDRYASSLILERIVVLVHPGSSSVSAYESQMQHVQLRYARHVSICPARLCVTDGTMRPAGWATMSLAGRSESDCMHDLHGCAECTRCGTSAGGRWRRRLSRQRATCPSRAACAAGLPLLKVRSSIKAFC